MKIKMKKTCKGAQNGLDIREYAQGEEYEVSDNLAYVFIKAGEAEKVKLKRKKIKSAPENKVLFTRENKAK